MYPTTNLLIAVRSVRGAVNSGDPSYEVTAQNPPAYLYEDPTKYDPALVLRGLMRGPFLVRVSKTKLFMRCYSLCCQCFLALYWSPSRALARDLSATSSKSCGLNSKYGLRTVTPAMIVYAAIQVSVTYYFTDCMGLYYSRQGSQLAANKRGLVETRCSTTMNMRTLSSTCSSSTPDGLRIRFLGGTGEYSDATGTRSLQHVTSSLVFGNENGLTVVSRRGAGVSLFAKAQAQLARIAAEEAAAEEAAAEAARERAREGKHAALLWRVAFDA
jgi:hypothetical protein